MLQKLNSPKRQKGSKSFPKLNISLFLAFFFGLGVGALLLYPKSDEVSFVRTPHDTSYKACFSPEGKCSRLIVLAIEKAEKSILIMAYSFTSPQIADALVKAHRRGVDVRVLIDKSQIKGRHSQLSYLFQNGVPIYIDPAKGLAHNKVMIFDESTLLTGSFNFTRAAENRNAENVLLIYDPALAKIYEKNWQSRAQKSIAYGEFH